MLDKLNRIAHLPLPVFFDADKIRQELESIPFEMSYYKSALCNDVVMDIFDVPPWKSIALYSINGSHVPNPAEPWEGDYKATELAKFCPYTYSIIDEWGGKLLARVENILPKIGTVGWHSHVMEARQPEWISVIQLPVLIPEGAKHSVVSYMEYRGSDYKKPLKAYDERYPAGQMYVLNSYHYHNAFNISDDNMLVVRFYVDIREPKIQELLQSGLDNYTGEFIPTYEQYVSGRLGAE